MLDVPQKSELLDKTPPSNVEAEMQTIGSVMLKPSILDRLASILRASDFYLDSHRLIFSELLEMAQEDRRIDMALFLDRLRQKDILGKIGGTEKLLEISGSVGVWNHWKSHAEIVLRESRRRQIVYAATEILQTAWTEPPEETLAKAEEVLSGIRTGSEETDPVTMLNACVEAIAEIQEVVNRKKHIGFLTGLPEFDDTIGGFFPGELVVIAARPGQGKTSIALQMAANIADSGRGVYFASLEMSRRELAIKRLCSVSGVSNQKVRTGQITEENKRALIRAGQAVGVKNLHIHDWAEIRPYDIQRAARRLNCEIIFVDYLQYVSPPDASKKRYEQVGDISRQLKTIARKMNIPVVACAQIGRQAEQGKESRPKLSHLRESGNIENDCDMAVLLWRPENGIEWKGSTWDAELNVAKNRKGATGAMKLKWDGEKTTFYCHDYQPIQRYTEFDRFS